MRKHTKHPGCHSKIVDLFQSGKRPREVAEILGCSLYHVQVSLKLLGVPARKPQDYIRILVDGKKLRELTDQKYSQREIAQMLGMSLPVLERNLRRLGIKSVRGRGSPLEKNYFWKGGQTLRDGYMYKKSPGHPHATKGGYVLVHRLVMEKVLERYLLPDEVVHHKDKNRLNNDPSNLEVFSTNADHLKHELTGRCPKWTLEGIQRIREGNLQKLRRQRACATQQVSKTDVCRLRKPGVQK